MTESPTKERILETLPTRVFGKKMFMFEEIDSTNVLARTLADTGAEEGTVVWAEFQTAGKGRHGRSWLGEQGSNLMFSIILRDIPDPRFLWVPYYVSEAIAGGIERTIDVVVRTKWPNDLLLNGRKVSGILLEGNEDPAARYIVAGVGINVNQPSFPPDLAHTATSLLLEHGAPIDRVTLYHNVLENMEVLFDEVRSHGDAAILDSWIARCTTIGKAVRLHTGSGDVEGTAIGLSKDGGLLMRTSEGLRTYYAGDVSVHKDHANNEAG